MRSQYRPSLNRRRISSSGILGWGGLFAMARATEVLKHVSDFLANRESLESFEDWSASYLHVVHQQGDADDRNAIHAVRSILNAFEDDDERSLREELQTAMLPFDSQIDLSSQYLRQSDIGSNDYGSAPMGYPISGNNNIGFNEVRSIAA
jgi:hypothetical protein